MELKQVARWTVPGGRRDAHQQFPTFRGEHRRRRGRRRASSTLAKSWLKLLVGKSWLWVSGKGLVQVRQRFMTIVDAEANSVAPLRRAMSRTVTELADAGNGIFAAASSTQSCKAWIEDGYAVECLVYSIHRPSSPSLPA